MFIFLTKNDRMKLSAFLKKPINSFAQKSHFAFTRFMGKGWQWHLKLKADTCQFLKEGKCSVYEARPTQCKTWPFWSELMDIKNWLKAGEECPGIGMGPELSEDEVTEKLLEQVKADAVYTNQSR